MFTLFLPNWRFLVGLTSPLLLCAAMSSLSQAYSQTPQHGIAMHGTPALPADFEHLPYANPEAPKGGSITFGIRGSFDSINPFILKGQKAAGLWDGFYGNNVYESLMMRSRDEPFSLYGLLAEKVVIPNDRSFIEFHLNKDARFSDGHPVTADDVIFSAKLLAQKGRPNFKAFYSHIKSLEKKNALTVRVSFTDEADRELPLLLALLPVLPEHAIDAETFDRTTLTAIIGTGPYRVREVDQGNHITLERNPDYWGRNLPVKRGLHNFDTVKFSYFRDGNTLFEAFKKGLVDVYFETIPELWQKNYKGRAVQRAGIKKTEIIPRSSVGMRGYAFNTRKVPLDRLKVRQALSSLFDFEWMNANLFNNGYQRTQSFFHGSELSSYGHPASPPERALLQPFESLLLPAVMDGTFSQPKSDGTGRDRAVLKQALALFQEEGFNLHNGVMRDAVGRPLKLELLSPAGSSQDRVALTYADNLRKLGIELILRNVDAAQFEERRKSFDYDMILWRWAGSLSPGNEQYFRWGSAAADQQGTFNFSGVKNPGIDAMIKAFLRARKASDFKDAVRAFDRLLLSGFYVLPHYHLGKQLIAHQPSISLPEQVALYGTRPASWWFDGKMQ